MEEIKRKYPKVERKHGEILGIKVSITSKQEVLDFINTRLESKEKFYVVTPNPENLLKATQDWLLEKAIRKSDLSIPDGIGLAQAYKFLKLDDYKGNLLRPVLIFCQGLMVGAATLFNKKYLTDALPIIKGRELFLDVMEIANKKNLRVYLFGGEYGESEKTKEVLEKKYGNITIKTNRDFPQYNKNCKPVSYNDRQLHKKIIGSIKMFEPDLIVVALNTPKQEKWIFRNFFRMLNVTGAFALGGTFNYVAGNMKLPPKWIEKIGLEWVYRLIQEPKRVRRILNAFPIFPLRVFLWKLNPQRRKKK
jgi:N-acetylglucosaminyldiphosphoundecaprenol N-acetyl-beta-D-mannosaminyltransferase